MDWHTFIAISHIIGTALGVGGASVAGIFYLQSLRLGTDSGQFANSTRVIHQTMRIGLLILVLSGFGYLILARVSGNTHWLYSPRLWVKLTIILILAINALLLQAKKIPFRLGAAISLTSWYAALVLGIWRVSAGYFTILLGYVIFVAVVWLVLKSIEQKFSSISSK